MNLWSRLESTLQHFSRTTRVGLLMRSVTGLLRRLYCLSGDRAAELRESTLFRDPAASRKWSEILHWLLPKSHMLFKYEQLALGAASRAFDRIPCQD